MNDQIKQAFDKVFGDMCLSDNDVALHIFELGYRAGMEDAAKLCEAEASVVVVNASEEYQKGKEMGATVCAAAIRARMK